jgi:hypothetical protein
LADLPAVPEDWRWPTAPAFSKEPGATFSEVEEEPEWFLGQINCRDLAEFESAKRLPADGLLYFYGDSDLVTGCAGSWREGGLYCWPSVEDVHLARSPVEDFQLLPTCGLGFAEAIDLPDPFSTEIQSLALDKPLWDRYFDLRVAVTAHGVIAERYGMLDHTKLFGWPDLVQGELDIISEAAAGDERLFFQLGNYDNGNESWSWGPGGLVYFVLSDAALDRGQVTQSRYEMQCT